MEKLDIIVVQTISKGTKGSAILYLPPQQTEIVYAITAKHCIFGKKFNNEAQPIDIQLVWNDGKTYSLNAEAKIHCFPANDPDIALLELPYAAIRACVGDLPMIRLSAWDKTIEKGSFKGFPNATDEKKTHKARTIKNLEILQEDSKNSIFFINTKQKLGSDDDSTIAAVEGFSGSGVWAEPIYDNSLYLLGIVTDVEDWNNRFECVKIEVIKDWISTNCPFSTPRQAEYRDLLHTASSDLRREKGYFGNYEDSHINRNETQLLLEWVDKPLQAKQRNVAVLTGDGGYGKTNVLRDLLLVLEGKLPVLAIKADKRAEKRLSDLAQQVFKRGNYLIETVINGLLQYHEKVVLIIDQLDALSQTLSTERAFLQTYDDLIQQFVDNPRVRIVMSIRKFDLEHDARLSAYKKETYPLDIQPLSDGQVQNFLSQIEIAHPSQKLVELLRIPNHLDIFCRLSDRLKANWDSLSSIRDLYDALWETLHDDLDKLKKGDLKIGALIFEMANQLNAKKQKGLNLSINPFRNKYRKALEYLQSKTIILENDKKIQFFHQTFYEYAYARDFVESGKALSQEILDGGQSLYIRSRVKLILEYWRDYDEDVFIKIVADLMENKKYRFHIKLLVINILGSIKNPNRLEKIFVKDVILTHEKFARRFIDSVFSAGWLQFLREKGIVNDYLTTTNAEKLEKNANLMLRLLRRNVNIHTDLVLDCFDAMPNITAKQNIIFRILFNLNHWENKRLLPYFDEYAWKNEHHREVIVDLLKKMLDYQEEYVFEKVNLMVQSNIDAIKSRRSYDSGGFMPIEIELLNKVYDKHPKIIFDIFLKALKEVVDIGIESYKTEKSPLHVGNVFYYYYYPHHDRDHDSDTFDNFIFKKLTQYIENKSIVDKNSFIAFFELNKNSHVIPILKLLLLGLMAEQTYQVQFMELISIIHSINGFSGGLPYGRPRHSFPIILQNTIKIYFPILNKIDQEKIINLILTLPYVDNFHISDENRKKRAVLRSCGKKIYVYMHLLPQSTIELHPLLKKRHQELQRKFGNTKKNTSQVHDGEEVITLEPYNKQVYEKMDFKAWKKSMMKFDANHERPIWDSRGGRNEHATKFREYVKQDVNKYAPFVETLIKERKVALTYIEKGLTGLIESNYDHKEILRLYKIIIKNDSKSSIYEVDKYLIHNKCVDLEVVKHLANIAINDHSCNVIGELMHYNYDMAFKEIVFETVEKMSDNINSYNRDSIIKNINYLNHWDKDRAFKIFMRFVMGSSEPEIFQWSIDSARYFYQDYFEEMRIYFDKIITMEKSPHGTEHLIYAAWYHQYTGANELFEMYLSKGDDAIVKILRYVEAYLWEKQGQFNLKNLILLERFLTCESKKVASAYSSLILRKFQKVEQFMVVYPFLLRYVVSKSSRDIVHLNYFLKYLILCSSKYPKECLDLITRICFAKITMLNSNTHYDGVPLQAILTIYSALEQTEPQDSEAIQKALDVFDGMLENEYLSLQANQALETLPTQRALALLD